MLLLRVFQRAYFTKERVNAQYSSNKKKVRKDCKEEAFLTDSE
jgi:hypothetical protein